MPTRILATALAVAIIFAPAVLRAQELELVGTLHTVWHDPLTSTGTVRRTFTVVDDQGRATAVDISEREAERFGGFDAIRLRRVRIAVGPDRRGTLRSVDPRGDMLTESLFGGTPEVRRYATILCRFPDFADVNPGTVADAERVFGTAYPGVAHYWGEVSDGRLSLEGSIVRGWYMMPQPRSYYIPGEYASTSLLGRDCAAAADADVDFSQFSGVNYVFNTNLDCCSYGGTGSIALDGPLRSIASTWLASNVFTAPGVGMHEVGHSLGLSHSSGSYGLVYDSHWDVMSMPGWHAATPDQLLVGSHINAYGKRQLGFIPAARDYLAGPGTHEIMLERSALPAENGHHLVARIPAPRFGPTQYYTVEARGLAGYDAPLGPAGIVIHRVGGGGASPSNVIDPDGDFDPNDEGALVSPGERFEDRLNGITVSVVERVGDAFRVRLEVASLPRITIDSAQRRVLATAGIGGTFPDSAALTLTGMPADAAWTARVMMAGPLALATTSGRGNGMLRWTVRADDLAPGFYDQEIRVDVGTAATASLRLRLIVTAPPTPVLALYRATARDSLPLGRDRPYGNFVSLTGPGADTTQWTATTTAPWITIGTPTDTGSASLVYTRRTAGLATGWHVATIRIAAPGTTLPPIDLVDSLEVMEPLSWRVAQRGAARTTLGQGAMPVRDSVRVELDGRYGTGASWYLTSGAGANYVVPDYPFPTGNGWAYFRRAPRDLLPGLHVGTLRLYLAADAELAPIELADTLVVTAAPVSFEILPRVTRDSVRGFVSASEDSVMVQPTGPGSSTRQWRAVVTSARLAFPQSSGQIPNQRTGPGTLRFIRNLADRSPGWHVDTMTFVNLDGSGSVVNLIDSLFVRPGPVPGTVAIVAAPHRGELRAGGTATLVDSAAVVTAGDDAATLGWTATTTANWITLTTASGSGPARLRWSRSALGLAPGWHVDTIRIHAPFTGASTLLVDSLRAYAALAVTSAAERPAAVMGASYADGLAVSGGPTGNARWRLAAGALPAGIELDSVAGTIGGVAESSGAFAFTVRAVIGADTAERALQLAVTEPTLAAGAVIDQVLGGPALGADARRYLDLQGNRNGRVDIGDVRAWRRRQAAALTAAERAQVDTILGAGRQP